MKHVVYYYSGTGNSLAVAKELEKTGAEVRSIAYEYGRLNKEKDEIIVSDAEKVGFVFPTYFLGLPRIVHEFLKVLEIKNAKYIYAVATMGWSIRGGVARQMKDYMKEKGLAFQMVSYVQMPMNDFTCVHVDEPERQKKLLEQSKKRIKEVVKLVQNEKTHFDFEPIGFMVKKRNIPFCEKAKNEDNKFTTTDECTGCGICSKMCSSGNIKMIDNRPQWNHDCQMCLSCFHNCPQKAIMYEEKGKEIPHYHHPDYSLPEMLKYLK